MQKESFILKRGTIELINTDCEEDFKLVDRKYNFKGDDNNKYTHQTWVIRRESDGKFFRSNVTFLNENVNEPETVKWNEVFPVTKTHYVNNKPI